MMKALLCKEFGPPENLVIEEVSQPVPAADEVRIGVHACGLNFADTLMIGGRYQVRPPLPFSPGLEVAGEVLEIGAEVKNLKPGDRVAAICNYGGLAEEVTVPAAATFHIPEAMDYVAASAFVIAYGTSHVALAHRANLQPGEVLLVHGASGGVGVTAVELGKLLGATVIATASTSAKLQVPRQYGADYLINYKEEDFRQRVKEITHGKGADVIYDPVGGDVFDQSVRTLGLEGRLLVIGFASGRIPELRANLALLKNINIVGVYWGSYMERQPEVITRSLATLLDWYQEGKLKPHISQTYPLAQAGEALNTLMQRQATGRIVVTVR